MDFGSKIHSAANFNYVHIDSTNEFKWFIFPNAIFISVYLESSKLFCCAKPSARAYLAYIVYIYSSIIFQNYSNFVRVFELESPQRFSHDPSYVLWWSMFFFRKVLKFGSEKVAARLNILRPLPFKIFGTIEVIHAPCRNQHTILSLCATTI